jgi:hypothetical protein
MGTTTMDGFFAIKDVAKALGNVSEDTLYRRVKSGELDALFIGDRVFVKSQWAIDAVERGLGSKRPDERDAAVARAAQHEAAERNKGNGPVSVEIGRTDDGKSVTMRHTYPDYDSRSLKQLNDAPRRAANLALQNKGSDTEGDEGRRTILRRLDPRPLGSDGKPLPAGFKIAPAEDPQANQGQTFAEQLAESAVPA